ncbi:MAG TPA: glycosyltransferase family 2 protein [Gemmatimonadota bacterium]|nr:glycosyltransferase family 2 protein [Gemmatimonadota bacterium]
MNRDDYPRISIVTANYNGEAYLECAIRSVLDQEYPDLEYIIIDGGSTDRSCDIVQKYAHRLAHWESTPDRGFAHAYNKGFARATGEIQAYLNSDDMYCPWAFDVVRRCFSDISEMEWLTTLYPMLHGEDANFVAANKAQPYNRELFYAGHYGTDLWWIQQESTFWRRSLWERAGGYFDENLELAIDADLWSRFFEWSELYAVATPLAGFRRRSDSKTGMNFDAYRKEFEQILRNTGKRPDPEAPGSLKSHLSAILRKGRVIPHTGKTVHWSHAKRRFVARVNEIEFTASRRADPA